MRRGMYLKNKTKQLNLRFAEQDIELIKRVAKQYNQSVSAFIYSVLIPFCLRVDGKIDTDNKKGGA